MRPLPAIHECMDNQGLRPAFKYALLNKKELAATDAHILVVHQSNEIFDEDFLNTLPEKGIFLKKEAIIDLGRKDTHSVIFHKDMMIIEVLHIPKGEEPLKRYYQVWDVEKQDWNYPEYNRIWPTGPKEAVEKIGLNPKLITRLNKALGPNNGVRFEFYGEHRSVVCKPLGGEIRFAKALIMPVILND